MHNVLIKKALLVKQMLGYVFACLLLSTIGLTSVNANPVDTFEFNDEVTKVRFQVLSKELRCPKCFMVWSNCHPFRVYSRCGICAKKAQ